MNASREPMKCCGGGGARAVFRGAVYSILMLRPLQLFAKIECVAEGTSSDRTISEIERNVCNAAH